MLFLVKREIVMTSDAVQQFHKAHMDVSVAKMLLWEGALKQLQLAVSESDTDTVRDLLASEDFRKTITGDWYDAAQMKFNGVLGLAMYMREEEMIKLMVKAGANPVGPYASYRDDFFYMLGEQCVPRDMMDLAVSHSTLSRQMQYAVKKHVPGLYTGHFLKDIGVETLPMAKVNAPFV